MCKFVHAHLSKHSTRGNYAHGTKSLPTVNRQLPRKLVTFTDTTCLEPNQGPFGH